jgi:hypothetical protein
MKKFFLFCLIVLSTSFIAKAQCFLEPNSNGDTIAYKIKDSINHYVTVVQYLGPYNSLSHSPFYLKYKDSLNIPQTVIHNGIEYTVKSIGEKAFSYCEAIIGTKVCDSLFNVTLPPTIDTIKESAFGCRSEIKSLILPNNIKYIGDRAFTGAPPYGSVVGYADFIWNDLNINIPDSITEINPFTFANTNFKDNNINSLLTDNIRRIDSFALALFFGVDYYEYHKQTWEEYKQEHLYAINIYGEDVVLEWFVQDEPTISIRRYQSQGSLRIPPNVEYIGNNAFRLRFFDTIFVTPLTPPIVEGSPFLIPEKEDFPLDSTIYIVPCQSYFLYKSADFWKDLNLYCMDIDKVVFRPNIDHFSFYPNPVDNILFFKYEYMIMSANIYDINGNLLINKCINAHSGYFDVHNLKPGQYILQLILENKTISRIFIKK